MGNFVKYYRNTAINIENGSYQLANSPKMPFHSLGAAEDHIDKMLGRIENKPTLQINSRS